jgi:hypothetical protein
MACTISAAASDTVAATTKESLLSARIAPRKPTEARPNNAAALIPKAVGRADDKRAPGVQDTIITPAVAITTGSVSASPRKASPKIATSTGSVLR